MKKWGLVLVVLLWILAGVQVVRSGESGGKERIMEVLGKVGTMEQVSVVDYYGILDEEVEDKRQFLMEAERALRINRASAEDMEVLPVISGNAGRSFEEYQEVDGRQITVLNGPEGMLKLVTKSEGEGQGQYFLAELSFSEEPEQTFARREQLQHQLGAHMRAARSSVSVIGSYSGKLTLEERNQAADELLEKMDARIVSENREMDLYTIYGYTPYIAEYQLQGGSAVNVNIAMHYNGEEDCTYIYAAVPVIGVDY